MLHRWFRTHRMKQGNQEKTELRLCISKQFGHFYICFMAQVCQNLFLLLYFEGSVTLLKCVPEAGVDLLTDKEIWNMNKWKMGIVHASLGNLWQSLRGRNFFLIFHLTTGDWGCKFCSIIENKSIYLSYAYSIRNALQRRIENFLLSFNGKKYQRDIF